MHDDDLIATLRLPEPDDQVLYDLLYRARDGDEHAKQALRGLVRDYRRCDPEIYTRALNLIGWFGDASLESALLAALADADYGCQAWTATACGVLKLSAAEPLVLGLLVLGLLAHPDGLVREAACTALGALGTGNLRALADRLNDDREHVRAAASTALVSIGGDQAVAALWAAFQARRFDRIGYLASALAQFAPGSIDRLLAATRDADPYLRYWAARALGATGERVRAVLERLAADDHARTRTGGQVSTAAKRGLKTLDRLLSRAGRSRR
jgi:HEAT repeat protein